MDVLLVIAALAIGALLSFLIKPRDGIDNNLAIAALWFSLFLGIGGWLFYFGIVKIVLLVNVFMSVAQWGGLALYLVFGYLVTGIWQRLKSEEPLTDDFQLKSVIRLTLWAVSILAGNAFLMASVGKLENLAYMEDFFKTSGYAIWFLYFIIAAEFLGGLGILLHFKLKTGPLAAAGIMLIMAGAVYTHLHRHDPLSDTYAAITQLITLSLLQLIYYFEKQPKYKMIAAAI